MAALNYPPHITPAIYQEVDVDLFKVALRKACVEASAVCLTFTRLRFFDGDPLVLWAHPSSSPALAQAHAAVHACIDPAKCRPHYRPGAWIPHCTLGTQIKKVHRVEAIAFATRSIEPFDVIFDVADGVTFPPFAILEEYLLPKSEREYIGDVP